MFPSFNLFFFFNDTATTEIYTLSLHDALPILRANLESVTAAAFDGETLELAFPPGRKFAVQKVQSKEGELRIAFADVFGVSPRIRCVARDGEPADVVVIEEEPPGSKDDVVARLKAEFGAEVEDE